MKRIILFVLLSFVCIAMSYSQTIQLLDGQQQNPIINATYTYGNQHGISNKEGEIKIKNDSTSTLYLSHINYGELAITPNQLSETLKIGSLLWNAHNFELQPVSIIALHQTTNDSLTIVFDNHNRLSHDAASVLSQLPEISLIRKSGSYGFDPVLRGFKYDQLNIIMDGAQSANAACPNRMDPPSSQMPVNMLSQITVLKGPYSLRFGNGIGGTINFKTEPLQFNNNDPLSGRLSGSYESNGGIWRSEGLVAVQQKTYNLKFYGAVSSGNNYKDGDGNEIASSFSRNNIGAIAGFKMADNQTIKLNISHNYAKNVDFPALSMDLRKDDTWLGSLHHTVTFNKKLVEWNTSLYSTLVDHLMDNYDKIIDPRMADAVTDAKTYNYGGRTEGKWQLGRNHLYLGADYRGDKAEGERNRTFLMGPNSGNTVTDNVWQDASVSRASVFAEFQQQINQWKLIYAGRIEYNQADANKPDEMFESLYNEVSSTSLNPSLSLGVSKKLNKSFEAELWLGHAQRSGSITERYINFLPVGVDPFEMIGNPELSSEKNNQLDVILKFQKASTQVQVSGFMAAVNDFISSEIRHEINPKMATAPGVRQFINIDNAVLKGFEITWIQQFTSTISHRLSMAYTHGNNKETNEALPEIPPMDLRYSLFGNFLKNKLHPELSFRHVWKQNRIASSFGETETPAFNLIDLSINYEINKHLQCNASINNLLDEMYYEHLSRSVKGGQTAINAPGRNMMFTIVARW